MSEDALPPAPVIIKKYANRRLYNTELLRYMSKDDILMIGREQKPFFVREIRSGKDITNDVLAWAQGAPNP
jgi:polyhydroxyalkanoate synthesis regulator protein